jgi:hypothetical protein
MSWFAKKQYSGSEPGNDYRYKRFTTRLLFRDLQFRPGSAKPGDALPPFELVTTGGDCLDNNKVFGAKPVLLIFGSVTCPMTAMRRAQEEGGISPGKSPIVLSLYLLSSMSGLRSMLKAGISGQKIKGVVQVILSSLA